MTRRTAHSLLLSKLLLLLAVVAVFGGEAKADEIRAENENATQRKARHPRWRASSKESGNRNNVSTAEPDSIPSDRDKKQRSSASAAQQQQQGQCDHHEDLARREARRRRWMRRLNDEDSTKTAYRMAVLATLAYLQFHKLGPLEADGFRLVTTRTAASSSSSSMNRLLETKIRHQLCRLRQWVLRHIVQRLIVLQQITSGSDKNGTIAVTADFSCKEKINLLHKKRKEENDPLYTFDYFFFDWYEPTSVPGVKYHDTDLIVSTQGESTLVLAFAGTASAADHVTNVQTFEPATHSKLFHGGGGGVSSRKNATNAIIEGSLHRGFLNAYSRVQRGSVLRLCQNCSSSLTQSLETRYGHCASDAPTSSTISKKKKRSEWKDGKSSSYMPTNTTDVAFDNSTLSLNKQNNTDEILNKESDGITVHKKGGCRSRDEHLMTILRDLVINALQSGKTVEVTGHSLGGGLATLLVLDIIINFPQVPVSRLHLWTFGAPQVADDVFLKSAMNAAPRLRPFVEKNGNGRFHRFVTLSDNCEVDFVSTLVGRALPSHGQNLRGRAARKLGSVRGTVVHFADPHYLLTPDQYMSNSTNSTTNITEGTSKTTTRSSITAHYTINYLLGISRESREHPLSTDLPPAMREWLGVGEPPPLKNATAEV